jgi:hypothetical protein
VFPIQNKFVGTTRECFMDLMTRCTDIRLLELIARFCVVNLTTVLQWREGGRPMGGESLLKLRVLLHTADYQVVELHALDQQARKLGMMVGFGILGPESATKELGYRSASFQSLWRILVPTKGADSGYSPKVGENIERLHKLHRQTVITRSEKLKQELQVIIGKPAPPESDEELPRISADPVLVVALQRSIATTASLGHLLRDPGQRTAIIELTHGGRDIRELIGVLEGFLSTD